MLGLIKQGRFPAHSAVFASLSRRTPDLKVDFHIATQIRQRTLITGFGCEMVWHGPGLHLQSSHAGGTLFILNQEAPVTIEKWPPHPPVEQRHGAQQADSFSPAQLEVLPLKVEM